MPWTDPLGFSYAGQAVSSADQDTYVLDNTAYLGYEMPCVIVTGSGSFTTSSFDECTLAFAAGDAAMADGTGIEITVDGFYIVTAGLEFPNGTYNKVAQVIDNTARIICSGDSHGLFTPTPGRFSISAIQFFTAGQTLRLEGFSDDPATQASVSVDSYSASLAAGCLRMVAP